MTRRTKIVATIGPASNDPETLRELIAAGVDVVRLNLSHGEVDEHLAVLERVRTVAEQVGRPVAVLADLPGPKVRCGEFPDGGVDLAVGSLIELVPGDHDSSAERISVDYETLLVDLSVGASVQLGDGAICLQVVEMSDDRAFGRVVTGGRVNGSPGFHLPSESLRLTTPTDEDLVLAEIMADAGVEFIAVSFVRRASDVDKVRAVVGDRAHLVSKIETAASMDHLDSIIAASDAVMVARGDLGIDCPIEDVPHLQKFIIRACVEAGVPVITATQMMESMIVAPTPTRAEVSDVANAVFDGTDAVMLSGETAIGRDPVAVITTIAAVARRAEREASYRQWANRLGRLQREHKVGAVDVGSRITMALSHAASQAAMDCDASAILCCTRTGRTARAMARFRPDSLMIGLSPDPKTVRTMALSWGVEPVEVEMYESTDEMVWFAVETTLQRGLIDHGDTVLVLAGAPTGGRSGSMPRSGPNAATDVLRLVQVD
ncbi:MAG: pyruvate kinase [Ilumatobacter sp.]|jgi:pyruvate kinase|uniref:pyruvate kinase n=1 Tax=Ilumatobacter sp. TaxID=1967498 RepID=UPI003918F3B3